MRPLEEEAFQVDAYLDELLAIPTSSPQTVPDAVEPGVEAIARLVQRALARFHPSFHFEERLAARLVAEAGGTAPASVASGSTSSLRTADLADLPEPIAIGSLARGPLGGPTLAPAAAGGTMVALERRGRGGLLLGGAIASGVSIAGAALIARARRARAEQRWQELS
jgi:hypothetical protein